MKEGGRGYRRSKDSGKGWESGLYQKGPLVIKVWGAKSQKTLWGWYKAGGPSD